MECTGAPYSSARQNEMSDRNAIDCHLPTQLCVIVMVCAMVLCRMFI